MKIIDAYWEQRNIGVKAFEIELSNNDCLESVITSEQEIISKGAEYIVVKIPVNMPELLFGLPKLGYTFVETAFSISLRKDNYIVPPSIARLDRGVEVRQVIKDVEIGNILSSIKDNMFDTDRISIDPYFTKFQSSNRYFCWTSDMINSGCKVYNVSIKDKDFGFFINKEIDSSTMYPVLGGIYTEYKGKGSGCIMSKKCIDTIWLTGINKIISTVVSNNLPILKIWLSFGTKIDNLNYVFVKHNMEGGNI